MTLLGIDTPRRPLLYLAGDVVLLLVALSAAHIIRFGTGAESLPSILSDHTGASTIFVLTNMLLLYVVEGYDVQRNFRRPLFLFRLLGAIGVAAMTQMIVFYLLPDWLFGRSVTLLANLIFGILLPSWRLALSSFRPRLATRIRTLILGDTEAGHILAEVIARNPDPDQVYDVLGFIDGTEDLSALIAERRVDSIIIARTGVLQNGLAGRLLDFKTAGVHVEDMVTVYKRLTGKVPIYLLNDAALLFGPQFSGVRGIGAAAQRAADIVFSLTGLLLSAPLMAAAAVAIKLESSGPVFFTQERVGRSEKRFTIIKLRTMTHNAESETGPVWSKGANDIRVTRTGRFLRRSRIDELPQFFNVLKGDMAIVGPRPERPFFVTRLKEQIPYFSLRAAVKPGLTGWAQVRYRYGATDSDAAEKLCYDLYAAQEMSMTLYGLILLKTVQTVLFKPGS
ncbi:MAG: sugar transferase [Myxococcota bacterium]|nr:sugar transferase [Myxococcota bacterium]